MLIDSQPPHFGSVTLAAPYCHRLASRLARRASTQCRPLAESVVGPRWGPGQRPTKIHAGRPSAFVRHLRLVHGDSACARIGVRRLFTRPARTTGASRPIADGGATADRL